MLKRADVVCICNTHLEEASGRSVQLMSRFARDRRVFYVERPRAAESPPVADIVRVSETLWRVAPSLPPWWSDEEKDRALSREIMQAIGSIRVSAPVLWFHAPMALSMARWVLPTAIVYDATNEARTRSSAYPTHLEREKAILRKADLVFSDCDDRERLAHLAHVTQRPVHVFPNGVDVEHFARARDFESDPIDQAGIRRPRAGYIGPIDESVDLGLVTAIADRDPNIEIVLVGPIMLRSSALPKRPNIHYLGEKKYADLPAYVAGWDVGILPLALDGAREGLAATRALELLAAHKPVVATAVPEVVTPYGDAGIVRIAARDDFAQAIQEALQIDPRVLSKLVDCVLRRASWDATWTAMSDLLDAASVSPMSPGASKDGAASVTAR